MLRKTRPSRRRPMRMKKWGNRHHRLLSAGLERLEDRRLLACSAVITDLPAKSAFVAGIANHKVTLERSGGPILSSGDATFLASIVVDLTSTPFADELKVSTHNWRIDAKQGTVVVAQSDPGIANSTRTTNVAVSTSKTQSMVPLSPGSHSLDFEFINTSSNNRTTPLGTINIFVDPTDPTASVVSGNFANGPIEVRASDNASNDSGLTEVKVIDKFGTTTRNLTLKNSSTSCQDSFTEDYSFLPSQEGTHQITVTATDRSGRIFTSATKTITFDKTAPTAPDNIVQIGSASDPEFTFAASTDKNASGDNGSGIAEYKVSFNNGASFATIGTATRFKSRDVGSGPFTGENTLVIRAVDRAGNFQDSASFAFTFTSEDVSSVALREDSGQSNSDGITNDNRVAFVGIADTNRLASYQASINGGVFQDVLDPFTTPLVFSPSSFATLKEDLDDPNTVQIRAKFEDGTTTAGVMLDALPGAPTGFILDSKAPTVPGQLQVVNDTGRLADDAITSDASRAEFIKSSDETSGVAFYEISIDDRPFEPIVNPDSASAMQLQFSPRDFAVGEATLKIQIRAVDVAGNRGQAVEQTVTVDATKPTFRDLDDDLSNAGQHLKLQSIAIPGSQLPVSVVSELRPSFEFEIRDQQFVGKDNIVKVELVQQVDSTTSKALATVEDDTTTIGAASGIFGSHAGATLSLGSLRPDSDLAANRDYTVFLRVTDAAGNTAISNSLDFFVSEIGLPTMGAPSTPVFTTTYDIRSAVNAALGKAGNRLNDHVHPWQMSFDKTTQTVWFSTEKAGALSQFDPATGMLKTFDLRGLSDGKGDNPHGIFFDFNTHLTSRVWVAHRNAGGSNAGKQADEGEGRLSYLDVVKKELVSFDFSNAALKSLLEQRGIHEGRLLAFHAAFTDANGDVWASSPDSNNLVQFDFDSADRPAKLDGDTPLVTVHPLPKQLTAQPSDFTSELKVAAEQDATSIVIDRAVEKDAVIFIGSGDHAVTRRASDDSEETSPGSGLHRVSFAQKLPDSFVIGTAIEIREFGQFHPHAFQVVVDDRIPKKDGNQWVWAIDIAGSGRIALLRPGVGPGGTDLWSTWDVGQFKNAAGSFVQFDDNETPGIPEDDAIIATFPVAAGTGSKPDNETATEGVVHRFSLKDPSNPLESEAHIQTWVVPKIPGSLASSTTAAVIQPFVDRSGQIFVADRYGSVTRFDPHDPVLQQSNIYHKMTSPALDIAPAMPIIVGRIEPTERQTITASEKLVEPLDRRDDAFAVDRASLSGLDQYEISGSDPNIPSRGRGLFRGAINAENTLYGSLAQSNLLSVTIFAESARRQMSAVASPLPSPAGAITQARMAFQVIRDGSVILTARGDATIADKQVNLLRELSDAGRLTQPANTFAIAGEANAVTRADGSVHVMGRSASFGVVQYTYSPPTTGWDHDSIFDMDNWSVAIRTDGLDGLVLAEDTVPAGPLGFSATTAEGHWLAIPIDPGETVRDLTKESATGPSGNTDAAKVEANRVYAAVGVTGSGDSLFGYGTNQTGSVVEYEIEINGKVTAKIIDPIGNNESEKRDHRMMRNVRAITIGDVRHLFATDGVSRLVHWTIDSSGRVQQENISQMTTADGGNFGYFPFQKPFTGRVYTYVAPLVEADGTIRVYGTNGGDLVEFTLPPGGQWRVANLTNDTLATYGTDQPSRVPANAVFGGPTAYINNQGGRHVLQINAEGEVIEYFTYGDGLFPNDSTEADRISSQNINFFSRQTVDRLMLAAPPVSGVENSATVTISPTEAGDSVSNAPAESMTSLGGESQIEQSPLVGIPEREDVNGDGNVTARDALLIINQLSKISKASGEWSSNTVMDAVNQYDVSGDEQVTALDALLVINYMNRTGNQPEGESPTHLPVFQEEHEERDQWDASLEELANELEFLGRRKLQVSAR